MRSRRPLLVLLALAAAHLTLLLIGDLSSHIGATIAVLGGASLMLWLGVRWLRHTPLAAVMIIAGAVILRLVLLPLPPTLSDDILRYVWDGEVAAAGFNPYRLPPADSALGELRDERWEKLPHKDVATVYPPLALATFALAAALPRPVMALKILLVLADLVACWLLLQMAERRRIPKRRVLLYAWNPLVCLEVAGMGHVDALGVAAVVATVGLLSSLPPRPAAAGLAAAAAVLAKVVPVVAWPAWARGSGRPRRFLLVGLGVLVIALWPVFVATGGVPSGYIRFGISWEFNGPLHEPLWRLLERLDVRSVVERLLAGAKAVTGAHELLNRLYPFNYPQFLAKALLGIVSIPLFLRAWLRRDPLLSTGAVFSVLLLVSATVYPWYLLWVLPWAALAGHRSWLLLAALLPLSYLPQFLDVELFPAVFCAIWVPFFLVLGLERRWSAN